MSAPLLLTFLATSLLLQTPAQDVDLAPEAAAPAAASPPAAAPPPTVTVADAERLSRLLAALSGYEADQRNLAALFGIAAGTGAAVSGLVIATDARSGSGDSTGPILIGVGAGVALSSVVMLFISGSGEQIAATFAQDSVGSPEARLEAIRAAEAALVELHDTNETGRYVAGTLLSTIGVGTGVLGAAMLAADDNQALRTTSAITLGSGAGLAISGLYLLAFGKTPIERFIDGYTMVTIGQTSAGDTTVGVSGRF